MNDRRFTRTALVLTATLAVFALAGCSGGGDADTSSSPDSSSASRTPTPAPEPTTDTATEDLECIYGTWTLDQAGLVSYFDQINQIMAAQGAVVEFTPEGSAQLVIDEAGTYDWMPTTVTTANIADQEMIVTMNGILSGTYTASPGVIFTDPEIDNQLQISATVGGVEIDPSAVAAQISMSPIGDSKYVCGETTLELTTTVAGASVATSLTR
ncbi:hypothetical protein LG299_08340 [Microbacterium lacus]|uniref:hypothetical protein n=1 Tax=Microbacterium lacus TaxID=415217 RepID=UPI003850E4C6